MLLIIEALFLISAAQQDHRAAVELDMAPYSVDDQYINCTKEMADLVEKKYLKKELKDPTFSKVWNEVEGRVTAPKDNLKKNHLIAIRVYTGKNLFAQFNKDVRSDKSKYKDKTFKWYSLHFLLTEAIQILKRNQKDCHSIYRGTTAEFKGEKGTEFRFGSFTSFSRIRSKTEQFGKISCFQINKYQGAELTNYSTYYGESEVLIPPYEMFKVIDVKTRTDQQDTWCDTVFILESIGTSSDLNCALFESRTSFLKNLFCGCCGSQ